MSKINSAEQSLHELMEVHLPENRNAWALKWKDQGSPVIGLLDSYFPEEIIYAAGIFPYRVFGTSLTDTPKALKWRTIDSCRYCNHVLESILNSEYSFLNGIIFTDWDDDFRRLYDVCNYIGNPSFIHITWVPRRDDELSIKYFAESLKKAIFEIEKTFNVKVTDELLWEAINVYDQIRYLLMQIYSSRKLSPPPLTGVEAFAVVNAGFFMPKLEYLQTLTALADYLELRRVVSNGRYRLLVMSDHLHDSRYIQLIENDEAIVVMDDLDTTVRNFWLEAGNSSHGDPVYALAKRYLQKLPDPRMITYKQHVDRLIRWAEIYQVDGVINIPHNGNYERLCMSGYVGNKLSEAGIKNSTILRDYHYGNLGQLSTRISAFLESIE